MRSFKPVKSVSLNTSSTNVTTAAIVQVDATGIGSYPGGKIQYFNQTTKILQLYYGKSGSEIAHIYLPPTNSPVVIEAYFPNNSRISVKAVDSTATSGYLTLDFFV